MNQSPQSEQGTHHEQPFQRTPNPAFFRWRKRLSPGAPITPQWGHGGNMRPSPFRCNRPYRLACAALDDGRGSCLTLIVAAALLADLVLPGLRLVKILWRHFFIAWGLGL